MTDKKWEKLVEEETEILDEVGEDAALEQKEEPATLAGILDHPSYKELEAKLTQAEMKADENMSIALREKAERENMIRRMNEEVRKTRDYSLTEFARDLLAVGDSLEQALQLCTEHSAMKEGIELTQRQLHTTLERFSVIVFDPVGEKFDPALHEAMSMVEDPNVESGKIIMVFQKGYKISDRLLRPARVIVAK